MPKMPDSDLAAILDAKIHNALGYQGGRLAQQRLRAERYYKGEVFGNEIDGRSQVVSHDVAEAVDSMMPSLMRMFNSIANTVTPSVTGQFAGAGRYGSGAYANALTSALANTAGNLAYQNYANERGNMMQANAQAPMLANQDYTDIGQLASVGDARQQLAQQNINAAIDRYNYNQNLPYNNLANFMRMIQGNYGSSSTQTSTNTINPIAGTLGLGKSNSDPYSSIAEVLPFVMAAFA